MIFIYSEAQNSYSDYLFSYQVLSLKEEKDSAEDLYDKGFLPVRSIKDVYYLSRSCRVSLDKFDLSSENKRVLKKMKGISFQIIAIGDFKVRDKEKFQREYLTDTSVKRILSPTGNFTHVYTFGEKGIIVAKITESLVHYAHQFYTDKTFGMTGMTFVVDSAKKLGKKYVYLGTCYGRSSLYKVQFSGFEFFDGVGWSNDLDKLKYLVERDGSKAQKHLLQDDKYLEKFYGVKKIGRLIKKLRNE